MTTEIEQRTLRRVVRRLVPFLTVSTSFYDGFGRVISGFTILQYGTYADIDTITDAEDDKSPAFRNPSITAYSLLTQVSYTTSWHPFGGDGVAFSVATPLVDLNTRFAADSPVKLSNNRFNVGDTIWGPIYQSRYYMDGKRPQFAWRFQFIVLSPTGGFSNTRNVNQGCGYWAINPYIAITYMPIPKLEFSTRFNYQYNFATSDLANPPKIPGITYYNGQAGEMCGPQATGGNFTDWQSVPDWHNIGYPIAHCSADGDFLLGKPAGTGGLITPAVVAEQTLYEIGDPAAYILPDVVADFSNVTIAQVTDNVVRVSGAKGRPPTPNYKVSAIYQDGYRSVATVSIVGPDAAAKAERTGQALFDRAAMIFQERNIPAFTATHIEALGAEASYGPKSKARAAREVLLRLVVAHASRDALEIFGRELGAVGLSGAPGITGIYNGRPKPAPVMRLFTLFLDKAILGHPLLTVGNADPVGVPVPVAGGYRPPAAWSGPVADPTATTKQVQLRQLAHARAGDKGNTSNIAVFARKPEYLPWLRLVLTPENVVAQLDQLVNGPAERFEAPGLHALNFLIQNALGGGGMASPRIDPQGKAYAQMLLEMEIAVPAAWEI